ncbi:unnamed protein product [Urochloa humidicola]
MAGCCRRRLLRLLGLLALLLTAFTCTCARPLTNKNGIILMPVASAAGASGGTPAPPSSSKSNTMMPRAEADRSHHHGHLPAAAGNKRYEWLLNRKPRGKPPPSAPSKRTN